MTDKNNRIQCHLTNLANCMNIKTEVYIQMLTSLLKNPEYSMFYEVIQYMIENKVRLEQENLI